MGRQPTDAEVRAYVSRLNAKERANPDIITTTTSVNSAGTYSTTQRVQEGKAPDEVEEAIRYSTEDTALKGEKENFKRAQYVGDIMAMLGVK
jgi:hypothetical protein